MSEWQRFAEREVRRFIRALDVVSIMSFDSVLVSVGYGFIKLASHFGGSGSQAFEVARKVSEAAFLLIYVAWVIFDLYDFLQEEYRIRHHATVGVTAA
jgi:hypothetical protein